MQEVKDARGLLCPEPLLIVKKEMDRLGTGTIKVLVDSAAARDNISRLAKNQKWNIDITQDGEEFLLQLTK
ncbi:sulfur transfer protein SirA [Pelotomaculum schinkii]|uniref:Sulfur transfer protein SirA n=1 Tax=Pelotomaculum schinkii TaxID=78350 RepID=A0A4Y7RFG1_9FIRM|nr:MULTISPECIES: sulfurtransferase TusA family protein [Pelotomaculum]TEB07519.1 sulfur transfer protein SirA [Pelotomaculum schinkii]TEB14180.1 sulfur transfer protein SirA [Pelotomaculum sp. FP]